MHPRTVLEFDLGGRTGGRGVCRSRSSKKRLSSLLGRAWSVDAMVVALAIEKARVEGSGRTRNFKLQSLKAGVPCGGDSHSVRRGTAFEHFLCVRAIAGLSTERERGRGPDL